MHVGGAFYGTTAERFWHYVHKRPDGHWIWTGPKNSTECRRDYGLLFDSDLGRNVLAHRYSYLLHKGPIPEDTEPDHLCRIPSCVAPDCLEAVPHRTNTLRGTSPQAANATKTRCPKGHSYDIHPGTPGKRNCSQRRRKNSREWYAANLGTNMGTGGANRVKTRCPAGHAYTPENTYIAPNRPGSRQCKICRREAKRHHQHRRPYPSPISSGLNISPM